MGARRWGQVGAISWGQVGAPGATVGSSHRWVQHRHGCHMGGRRDPHSIHATSHVLPREGISSGGHTHGEVRVQTKSCFTRLKTFSKMSAQTPVLLRPPHHTPLFTRVPPTARAPSTPCPPVRPAGWEPQDLPGKTPPSGAGWGPGADTATTAFRGLGGRSRWTRAGPCLHERGGRWPVCSGRTTATVGKSRRGWLSDHPASCSLQIEFLRSAGSRGRLCFYFPECQ